MLFDVTYMYMLLAFVTVFTYNMLIIDNEYVVYAVTLYMFLDSP